LNDLELL